MVSLDKDYARHKLDLLLRDLDNYNAGEFWREMSRIASGATGREHAEQLKAQLGHVEKDRDNERFHRVAAEGEISNLQTECNGLALHGHKLSNSLLWLANVVETEFMPHLEDYQELAAHIDESKRIATQAITSNLTELKSDVARQAYKQGACDYVMAWENADDFNYVDRANEYAERVKRGVV